MSGDESDNGGGDVDMSIINTKGLSNRSGENNCFLNSAVQVLWHLDIFRQNFRLLDEHACTGAGSCIFCALKTIFTHFEFSEESVLELTVLREALAKTFKDKQKFQIGMMDDAAECFENLLLYLHCHAAYGLEDTICRVGHCLTHQKFAMNVVEQTICECGATSEPKAFVELVHYISTRTIVSPSSFWFSWQSLKPKLCSVVNSVSSSNMGANFAQNLRASFHFVAEKDKCPMGCGRQAAYLRRTLINDPDVISIGLIWESDNPSSDFVRSFVRLIDTRLKLTDLFSVIGGESSPSRKMFNLVGVVCYYGQHYSTFFFHSVRKLWISFDDANVSEIGSDWDTVVVKMCRGRYQPLLLIYQSSETAPLNTTTAIKKSFKIEDFLFSFRNVQSAMVPLALRRNNSCNDSSSKKIDGNCFDQRNLSELEFGSRSSPQQSNSTVVLGDNPNVNNNCNIKQEGSSRAVLFHPTGQLMPQVQPSTYLGYIPARPPQRPSDRVVVDPIRYANGMTVRTLATPAGFMPSTTYVHQNLDYQNWNYGTRMVSHAPIFVNGSNPSYQYNQLSCNGASQIPPGGMYCQRSSSAPFSYGQPYHPASFYPTQSLPQTAVVQSASSQASGTAFQVSKASPQHSSDNTASVVAMLADAMIDVSDVSKSGSKHIVGPLDPLHSSLSTRVAGSESRTAAPEMGSSSCDSDASLSEWSIISPESPDTRSVSSHSSNGVNDKTGVSSSRSDESDISLMSFNCPPSNLGNGVVVTSAPYVGHQHVANENLKKADDLMSLCDAKVPVDKHSALLYCNQALVRYQMSLEELNCDVKVPPQAIDYVRRRINEALIKNGTIDMAIKSHNSSKLANREQQTLRSSITRPTAVAPSNGDLIQLTEATPSVRCQLLKEHVNQLYGQQPTSTFNIMRPAFGVIQSVRPHGMYGSQ